MELRPLGNTGLSVSAIGFGAFKIGRNQKTKYPDAYELPDERSVGTLLEGVLECGINLIDTAPAYGLSEERIGRFLAGDALRERVVLATKVGERFEQGVSNYAFDRSSVNASIDESLARLRTDRLDLVSVHSDGNDLEIIHSSDVLEVLAERRERGDIGAVGFSGKTVEGHRACLDPALGVGVLMIELNPTSTEQLELLGPAAEAGVGVLVKKGLASGRLSPAEALPWLLAHPEVASVVIGGRSLENVRRNAALLDG